VLFPDSLEAHLRLVGGSLLDLDWMNKHACTTLAVAEEYSVKFVIRKTADKVGASLPLTTNSNGSVTTISRRICAFATAPSPRTQMSVSRKLKNFVMLMILL
jgi:hypothetical protein